MKVAIATQDLVRVNAHLGWAEHLMFFEVSEEGYIFVGASTFPAGRQDGDHDKLVPRLQALKGCNLLFAADVGPDGEVGLAREKVVPIRRFAGQSVAEALDALRDGLRGHAPPWLRQIERRSRSQGDDERD